jgi:hypothetical protein
MSQVTPVRMVLRYREQPFQDLGAMIKAFFDWRDLQPLEDYCTHICSDPPSSKLYLVLDLHCKTCPDVDLSKLELQVFKVSRNNTLYVASTNYYNLTESALSSTFQDLGEVARKQGSRAVSYSRLGNLASLIRGVRRRSSSTHRTGSWYIRVLHIES